MLDAQMQQGIQVSSERVPTKENSLELKTSSDLPTTSGVDYARKMIRAGYSEEEAARIATEHMYQQLGLERPNITEKKSLEDKVPVSSVLGRMYSDSLKGIKNFSRCFYQASLVIPTGFRKVCYPNCDDPNLVDIVGAVVGLVSTFFLTADSLINFSENHNPLYLIPPAILATTNITSGFYELYKYNENKIVEERKQKKYREQNI